MRNEFEKWFRREIGAGSLSYHEGRYSNEKVNLMWTGFVAGRKI
jgi:hypothetical protein